MARRIPILPAAVIGLFVMFALFAPLLSPYDPTQIALTQKLKPPLFVAGGSTAHLLGTDTLGRDVLSRLIWGVTRLAGRHRGRGYRVEHRWIALGLAAGYVGGRTDSFLMRVADGSMAFPGILIALLFAVSLGPGVGTVILALSVLSWATYARIVRGEVLHMRQLEFVLGARVIGCSPARVMARHLFPNLLDIWVVMITLQVGLVVLSEAALGFLGAGRAAADTLVGIARLRRPQLRRYGVVDFVFPGSGIGCWCCRSTTWATGCATGWTRD